MATFAEAVDKLVERATGQATMTAAAQAMADTLTDVASSYLGGDLTMSRTGRTVVIEPVGTAGTAALNTGGAYGLADGGRHAVRRAKARRRSALNTPWGPRASVSGSTWAGFAITERAATDVLTAGKNALLATANEGG